MGTIEKTASFVDNNGIRQTAKIKVISGTCISIDSYDQNDNITGYLRIYFNPNKKLNLDVIYCIDKFKGNGTATMLSNLADYMMKDYEGYVIRGVFEPKQMPDDKENNIIENNAELEDAVREFYTKAGYDIIDFEDYIIAPEKYPYIKAGDFQLREKLEKRIVAKVIVKKDYQFAESDGQIIQIDNEIQRKKI